MFGLEKWADAFDKMHADVQRDLDAAVAKLGRLSGDTFGADSWMNWFYAIPVGAAYSLATFTMSAGKGLVDVLRLGEGVKSGTVTGVGQDVLRVLNLVPAVGLAAKGVGLGGRAVMVASAARAATGGPMSCGVISSQVALQASGTRVLITAEEVANLAGKTAPNAKTFSGLYYPEIKTLLQGASTATQELNTTGKGIQEIEAVAAQGRGPVVFGVQVWGKVNGISQPLRNGLVPGAEGADHWMVAFRNMRGQVMVADQYGVRAIAQAGNTGTSVHQFTVTSRALLVGDAALVRGLGSLENAGGVMAGANSAGRTNWLASSLAFNMVLVNTPTMAALDAEQRKRSGQPPRDWTTPSGGGVHAATGGASGSAAKVVPAPATFPKPNMLSSTVVQDGQLVLSKLPANGDGREVSQLQVETGLSAARVLNAVLQLLQTGMVRVKTWTAVQGGQPNPAMVERALRR